MVEEGNDVVLVPCLGGEVDDLGSFKFAPLVIIFKDEMREEVRSEDRTHNDGHW